MDVKHLTLTNDTHHYDYNLVDKKKSLSYIFSKVIHTDKITKYDAFVILKDILRKQSTYTVSTQTNINTIITDFVNLGHSIGPNYDNTNDLYADDLLYILYILVQTITEIDVKTDLIDLINIQLDEMNSGMCASGRTHRLFQIICAYEDYFKIQQN